MTTEGIKNDIFNSSIVKRGYAEIHKKTSDIL